MITASYYGTVPARSATTIYQRGARGSSTQPDTANRARPVPS